MVYKTTEHDLYKFYDGEGGKDGKSTYFWVKYSQNANGSGMTDDPTNAVYIGIAYNKTTQTESTNPADYSWSLIKGEDGTDGVDGQDGYTVVLSNEAQSIGTSTALKPLDNKTYSCIVSVFKGTTKLTPVTGTPGVGQYKVTLPANPTGITLSQSPAGTVNFAVTVGTAIASAGAIDLLITIGGVQTPITKSISYSASKTGATGASGVSATHVILSDENHTFAANSSGQATATTITTDVMGFTGANRMATTVGSITGLPTGMTMTINNNGATNTTISIAVTTSLTTLNGSVNIPVTVNGVSFTKKFSFTLSKAGASGSSGAAAKSVDITATSQMFKSTDGGLTFTPDNIKLTPVFQGGIAFSKWQYSTNGGTSWIDVASGSNGLTVASGILTIAKTCNLFTDSITALSFKCVSNNTSYFDVMTILKLYDVTDIQIGGRNLFVNTSTMSQKKPFTTTSTSNDNYIMDFNGKYIYTPCSFKAGDTITVQAKSNLVWSSIHGGSAANHGKAGFWLYLGTLEQVSKGLYTSPLFIGGDNSTTNFVHTRTLPKVGDLTDIYIGFRFNTYSFDGVSVTGKLWDIKLERGNKPTDWTPAPEDIDTQFTEVKTTMSDVKFTVDEVNKKITEKIWQTDIVDKINNYNATTVKAITDRMTVVEKDVTGIRSTVSEVQTNLSKKADGTTVTTLTNRVAAAEQNINGFKTTVEASYATKSYADTKKNEAINAAASDATTKANNALASAKSYAEQTVNGFKTTVSATYATKTENTNSLNTAKSYADTKKAEAVNAAASDATTKANNALASAKSYAEQTVNGFKTTVESTYIKNITSLGGTQKSFVNLCNLELSGDQKGFLVIKTPITWNYMCVVHLQGYNYLTNNSSLDCSVSFYAYSDKSFINNSFISNGTFPITSCNLYREGNNAIIVLNAATTAYSYPRFQVDKAIIGYNAPPDSFKSGWSMQLVTSVPSTWTNKTAVTVKDTQSQISTVTSQYTQLSNKFNWVVKSGTSASDFTITDRVMSLTAQYINVNGMVTFSGLNADAQTKINTATNNASSAVSTANTAKSTADSAKTTATNATTTANTAKSTADTAKNTADSAKSTATTASTTANTAKSTAESAKSTATTANNTANAANTTANSALSTANTAVNLLTVQDTRSTNQNPQWYFSNYPKKVVREFKNCTSIGLSANYGTYCQLETHVPWGDSSGGWPTQVAHCGTSRVEYRRIATSTTAWGAWESNDLTIAGWCYNNNKTVIDGGKIYTGTVTATQLAANSVISGKIAANAVTSGTIAAGAVTAGKIAARSIAADRIATGVITANEIASNAITTAKIVAGAINTDKIAAGAITAGKIATDAIRSNNYSYSSGNFSVNGTFLDLANGLIRSKNFAIDGNGNTYIKGNINGTTLTASQTVNIYNGNAGPYPILKAGPTAGNNALWDLVLSPNINQMEAYIKISNTVVAGDSAGLTGVQLSGRAITIGQDSSDVYLNGTTYLNGVSLNSTLSDTGWKTIIGTSMASSDVVTTTTGGMLRYRKKNGIVHIQGTFGVKNVPVGTKLIFTMPAGYRVTHGWSYYFVNTSAWSTLSRFYIRSDGCVYLEWIWNVETGKRVTGDVSWTCIDTCYPV